MPLYSINPIIYKIHNHLSPPHPRAKMRKINEKINYYDNGELMSKAPYVSDKKHGIQTAWYESGEKWWEQMRKEGKEHGVSTWWHDNGTKWSERMFKQHNRHGMETWWDENGERKEEIYYIAGKECARIEWSEEGNVSGIYLPIHIPDNKPKPRTRKNHTKG